MTRLRILLPSARLIGCIVVISVLGACADLRYYAHVTHGESALLLRRRSVDKVIADPATDAKLAARLALSQQARQFASKQLYLPNNRSYTYYVELHRPYVVWNVYATPRFSVDAVLQCFPIAGCVAYRGWFDQKKAVDSAVHLRAQGNDVYVGGVPAYSTLGWFADPILSSMMRWDDDELAGTIFHELAHQLIYLKGDTAFNESYAMFVENQGLREWHRSRGEPVGDDRGQAMEDGFTQLVLDLRSRLKTLYASGADDAAMAAGKEREIADFRARYAAWRDKNWPNDHRYDAWVARPINNATLLPFGLYDQWVQAFAVLFKQAGSRWPAFYDSVRELAKAPKQERENRLKALLKESGSLSTALAH
ncbi:aminopeptidase [Dyella psychrodurans]|uniref:Aminopeptidase n=1 Tax=Dyella psychrodurans TaxID=1927960 RepID=A0A370WVY5_9GAMM|nr:aminopeptidase [Dyella psychrodurans]RDS80318.1 aminopeptidase [Dyella psychrodurans]